MAMIISAGFATLVAGVLTAVVLFANGMRSSPGEFVGGGLIKGSWIAAAFLWAIVAATSALAQEHRHRPQDAALHHKFYKTWMMPDNRSVSCCNDEDCRPAEVRKIDGKWHARQDGDEGDFTPVPPQKVEQERDSPDGRPHLCGRRYGFSGGGFSVFCFIHGSGT